MDQNNLSHLDQFGNAHIVDISNKEDSFRSSVATGSIYLSSKAYSIATEHNEINKKGDVLSVARIAAIQACKQTATLIPLCHPLFLSHVSVNFILNEIEHCITIEVKTDTVGKTGVEMEALTGVSIGLLTIYDMLKAIDKNMEIRYIQLLKKTGGTRGNWERPTNK